MKLLVFLVLFANALWARPLVLVGHFDPFGTAPFNNSERVAKMLFEKMKDHPDVELRLCSLNTVFDKSFYQLEDCYKSMTLEPKMVLGLGESNCNFKIETMARNLDRTKGPDNEGNERSNSVIVKDAPREFGFNYPLANMYCALNPKDRAALEVSNNAGSFVCNNLAYQFAWLYQEAIFGFIHVPANGCRNIEEKSAQAVKNLETMILASLTSTEVKRLSTTKKELEVLRDSSKNNKCLNEFYKRTKGADEKGFWSFSAIK
jgi:pyrrolidone-carboxylate peptidase